MARYRTSTKAPYTTDDFIGPQLPTTVTIIPFPGFYSSYIDVAADHFQEQEIEHELEKQSDKKYYPEDYQPKHLRLTRDEFQALHMDHIDYSELHTLLAKRYTESFNQELADHITTLAKDPGIRFESVESPNEYNFVTDRLFVHIPTRTLKAIARYVLRTMESREILKTTINANHKSRDGFISFYSTDLTEWASFLRYLATEGEHGTQPDHNQINTIIEAAIESSEASHRDFNEAVMYDFLENDDIYQEYYEAFDYEAYTTAIKELREEKQAAYYEQNPHIKEQEEHARQLAQLKADHDNRDLFSNDEPEATNV